MVKKIFFVLVLALGLSCIGFLACGSDDKSDAGAESVNDKSPAANPESTKPEDWKTVKYEGWSISFPNDWNGGMSLIHFVDCQAPSSEFENHRSNFEKIIASFNK